MSRHLAHTFLDAIVLTLLRTFVDTLVDAYVDTFGGDVSACHFAGTWALTLNTLNSIVPAT